MATTDDAPLNSITPAPARRTERDIPANEVKEGSPRRTQDPQAQLEDPTAPAKTRPTQGAPHRSDEDKPAPGQGQRDRQAQDPIPQPSKARADELPEPARQDKPSQDNEQQAAVLARARAALDERYITDGREYRFRAEPTRVAFVDEGKKLTTQYNSADVAKGLIDAAQTKGWDRIKVQGTDEFRREVWLEGQSRNVNVQGYTPTRTDRELLANTQAVREAQGRVLNRWQQQRGDARSDLASAPGAERVARAETSKPLSPPEQVVALGSAPYKNQQDEPKSYYIKLRNAAGHEREVWGKDLQRAVKESQIKVGDAVRLHLEEKKPVEVIANVRDSNNQVVGQEVKQANLNTWQIQKVNVSQEAMLSAVEQVLARKGVTDKVRADVMSELKHRQERGAAPKIEVYDRSAPRAVERSPRTVEPARVRERAR